MGPQPTVHLSDDQIGEYRRQGFLIIDAFTVYDELERIRAIYDALFARRAGREVGDEFDLAGPDGDEERARLPQILSPSKYAPELLDTLAVANADAIAKQILGPDGCFAGDHAILKPAGHGVETPWHQDEAYWDPAMDYDSFSIWLPLDGATVASGCLHFIPGSHMGEVVTHRPIGNDCRVHGLEAPGIDGSGAIACPLTRGCATIHHNRTLHYAGPNLTEEDRRAYILMCGAPATPRSNPRAFPWKDLRQTPREARARSARDKGD